MPSLLTTVAQHQSAQHNSVSLNRSFFTSRSKAGWLSAIVALSLCACTGAGTTSSSAAQGHEETLKTEVLEAGAATLQNNAPLDPMNVYLVGFHPMKDDPSHQMEAHHYCNQVNEEFAQCALFDGNTQSANLTGVEYIISKRLFEQLPEQEKTYWHPHNAEILSGQLVAPGLPEKADYEVMKSKMNSYGKTWHTWSTDQQEGAQMIPMGDPKLAWSFNRLGEDEPGLVEARDKRMNIDTEARRKARSSLTPLAEPQRGVDTLKGQFGRPTQEIPGVVDQQATKK